MYSFGKIVFTETAQRMGDEHDSWLVKLGVSPEHFQSNGDGSAASDTDSAPAEPGLLGQIEEKARAIVGAKPQIDELKRLKSDLENGERAINVIKTVGDFEPEQIEKLEHAGETMGALAEEIDRGLEVTEGLEAILEIHEALKVLNDPKNIQPGSRPAAKAFGQLFHGAAFFVKKLPKPLNAYAPIFEGCLNFFSDIQRLNDPMTSPNEGEQLREIMKEP